MLVASQRSGLSSAQAGEKGGLGSLMRHRQVSGRVGGPCSRGPEFPAGGPLQIAPDVASSESSNA